MRMLSNNLLTFSHFFVFPVPVFKIDQAGFLQVLNEDSEKAAFFCGIINIDIKHLLLEGGYYICWTY